MLRRKHTTYGDELAFASKEEFIEQYNTALKEEIGKDFESCTTPDRYALLAKLVANKARAIETETSRANIEQNKKKVYYFSLEFLPGKFLDNYLMNLGVRDMVAEAIDDMGGSYQEICDYERDPGLGSGGLGRLAACFMDSIAHNGVAGFGNGMRYRYGLFKQVIENGVQHEEVDDWANHRFPWETRKPESAVRVRFGGEVVRHEDETGKYWFSWEGGDYVRAVPYDIPILAYGGKGATRLRLWSAEPHREDFDLDAFNRGDYGAAIQKRAEAEAISYILYPNDSTPQGKLLRLKQEYLFTAAGLASIIRNYKQEHKLADGSPDWTHFKDHIAIHTNDTHPALAGPELMRILVDEEGLDWDEAWEQVVGAVSYTNHTVMPEALEKWPIEMFRELLPRVYNFIEEINRRYHDSFDTSLPDWQELFAKTSILWDGEVRMANLSVICGHSVNGVASIHTEILKDDVLKEFYQLTPEKFNNKTNGITHRRFLAECNRPLSGLITEAIGDGWMDDANELEKLEAFADDSAFLEKITQAKLENKQALARFVHDTIGVSIDPNSMLDVQVKRMHAYKRQLLNALKIIELHNRMIEDPNFDCQPTTFLFAGKAAANYAFAKDVIRLIHGLADVINSDPRVRDRLKVVFVPNFSVSSAQKIYPAADIGEQISTAGTEASGTSNMKLMINGAITLGTLDGANVEIYERLGDENMEIFGMRAHEVVELQNSYYYSWDEYNADRQGLGCVIDRLVDGSYASLNGGFEGIFSQLMEHNDVNFVLRDFRPYVNAWEHLAQLYQNEPERWARMSLLNTARAGFFSSDRTIAQYSSDIWNA